MFTMSLGTSNQSFDYLIPATRPAGIILDVSKYRCPMTQVSMAAQTVSQYTN